MSDFQTNEEKAAWLDALKAGDIVFAKIFNRYGPIKYILMRVSRRTKTLIITNRVIGDYLSFSETEHRFRNYGDEVGKTEFFGTMNLAPYSEKNKDDAFREVAISLARKYMDEINVKEQLNKLSKTDLVNLNSILSIVSRKLNTKEDTK
jgi:hypothetical protein